MKEVSATFNDLKKLSQRVFRQPKKAPRYLFFALVLLALLFFCGFVWQHAHAPVATTAPFSATAGVLREQVERWKTRIQQIGAEAAYSEFLSVAPTLSISTHEQAHAFGEALYDIDGLDGLKVCDGSFAYGCYHSFFGLAVHDQGLGALPKFAESCRAKFGADNLPCEHGIGHGVLVYTNYDLQKALELCKTISARVTGGCSSGVYMEYNFHSMDENSDGSYVREKTDDLLAPCSTLPTEFQPSCYSEQPQWWQSVLSNDFKQMGQLCGLLVPNSLNYNACYNGIGNYIAADANSDITKVVPQCALMPSEATVALCHEGATWLIGFDRSKLPEAKKLCEILPKPYDSECFQKLPY